MFAQNTKKDFSTNALILVLLKRINKIAQLKIMKKIFKIIAVILLVIIVLLLGFSYFASKPIPHGERGSKAEALTNKIQLEINQKAWETTAAISFTFRGEHHYLWDKANNNVQVKWDGKTVIYNNQTLKGIAYDNDQLLTGDDKTAAIKKANDYFNNDSFWLVAPFKLRDLGTTRSIVKIGNQEALLVTYASGGSTPGDSYLWLLDADDLPRAWQMWVGIIPIGGIEASWEDWTTFPSGLRIATMHRGLFDLKLDNVKVGQSVQQINDGNNPFTAL